MPSITITPGVRPAFTIAALYWTRWWYLRPPRTWYEHVRSALAPTQTLAGAKRTPDSTR